VFSCGLFLFLFLYFNFLIEKRNKWPFSIGIDMKGEIATSSLPITLRRKEVNFMELTPAQKKTIEHQYDTLMRDVLRCEAKDCHREYARKLERESLFSELSTNEQYQLQAADDYPSYFSHFNIMGYDIAVKSDLLGEALENLPEKKRDIILMAYFLDMSDEQIGKLWGLVRSTIYRHRTSTLNQIKKYIEEVQSDEQDD